MNKARWITWDNREWRISELAREHHYSVGTLAARINRFGSTTTGITRALCTGIVSRETNGKRSKMVSPWRYPLSKGQDANRK